MHIVSAHVVLCRHGKHPYKVVLQKEGLPVTEYEVDSIREGEALIRSICAFPVYCGMVSSPLSWSAPNPELPHSKRQEPGKWMLAPGDAEASADDQRDDRVGALTG